MQTDAGAVTWCNGNTGCSGVISAANSLVGTTASPVGGPKALRNYVVSNPRWDNGAAANVGAATWASGVSGIVGYVTPANSIIGNTPGDEVGDYVTAMADGNYVISSAAYDHGAIVDAGAVTWLRGDIATVGNVSAANSLVGTQVDGNLSSDNLEALPDGRYVIQSSYIDNGPAIDAGQFSLIPRGGLTGSVPAANSILGTVQDEGTAMYFAYDLQRGRVVVGHGPANRVVLMTLEPNEFVLFRHGFE